MFKADNLTKLLIGKDIASTAGVQITDPATGATYIADGELTILDQDDAVLTPGDTTLESPTIRIVQGRGGALGANGLKSSVVIDGNNIISVTGTSYRAPVEQISFVGSDGATGAIDVLPYNDYKLTINYKQDKEVWSEQQNKRSFYYTTGASDTQETIVDAFIALIEDSEFYEAAVAKTTDGTNFGISFTGRPLDFKLGDFEYNKMLFDIQLSGFGVTDNTTPTPRDLGQGVYEQIAEHEWFGNGFYGVINRVHHPAPEGTSDAVAGETYDVIAIESFDTSEDYPVSGQKPSRVMTLIALPDTAAQTATLLAQLNPWIATTNRAFAAIAV